MRHSHWVEGMTWLERLLTASDAGTLAYARLHQGSVAAFSGDFDLAVARAEECLKTCHEIPQGFSCNGALFLLARATLPQGEDERAVATARGARRRGVRPRLGRRDHHLA